jgi:hypothetical protein
MDIKNRKISFVVKENTYSISHPTVGQYFDIEAQKSLLSKGQYGSMLDSSTSIAYDAIELINIVAIFKVLCPELIKGLGDKSLRIEDIDVIDFKPIRDIYRNEIKPWYDNWYSVYTGSDDEKK